MLIYLGLLLAVSAFGQSGFSTTATFGRHSDCSTGRGTCSFALSKLETGMYSRKTGDNTLTVEIMNSVLKESDQIKIAGKLFNSIKNGEKSIFVQEETIVLDSTAIENLNLNRKFNRINAGSYAMQITKDKTEIVFVLKNAD